MSLLALLVMVSPLVQVSASRREPTPESAVLVTTVEQAVWAAGAGCTGAGAGAAVVVRDGRSRDAVVNATASRLRRKRALVLITLV